MGVRRLTGWLRLWSLSVLFGTLAPGPVSLAATDAVGSPLEAQGVTQRTPNLEDGWTVRPGVIQFNFLHRFTVGDAPARKVSNFPTFNVATGLPGNLAFGVKYATNSDVFTGVPNEYELWLRTAVLRQAAGAPLDLAVTGAYNTASISGDGQLTAGRTFGPVQLLGVGRAMSAGYDTEDPLFGAGGGAVFRLTRWLALAGDVFKIFSDEEGPAGEPLDFEPAWGVGAQLGIPFTPHTLSIQVVNTNTGSIQGSSRGSEDETRVGFEFTIPITLSRYFGPKAPATPAPAPAPAAPAPAAPRAVPTPEAPAAPAPEAAAPAPEAAAPADTPAVKAAVPAAPAPAAVAKGPVTEIKVSNFAFGTPEVRIKAGGTVRWSNDDQVQHTVTADDASYDSGLIDLGKTFERTFEKAGSYAYHCTPHPFMKGTVVVE